MQIYRNFSLKPYNTFGFEARAAVFAQIDSEEDLRMLLEKNTLPIQILGGGSNVLFLKEFYDALFIKIDLRGIRIIDETKPESVIVEVGSGENWHNFVSWAIENDFGGIENLSLIPGTVGASPIQNIGAYGVELKDVFVKLEAINLKTLEKKVFFKADCAFGYRDSVFKNRLKNTFLITKVYFELTRAPFHSLKMEYGDIKKKLALDFKNEKTLPTLRDISNVVIKIRQAKLPDPKIIGNAGSFFKNPEIPLAQFEKLKILYPNIVGYTTENGKIKVAAGWLIEKLGWKGKKIGNVGVHTEQALVLVHYGDGKSSDIVELSHQIQVSVFETFGIALMTEVNFI